MQTSASDQDKSISRLNKNLLWLVFAGTFSVAVILGGVGAWASLSQINGAVIASGRLVVEGDLKRVQHREGGTVTEILVVNGEKVIEGQPLIHLDTLELGTELNLASQQHIEWMAKLARLEAERDEQDTIAFPNELTESERAFETDLIAMQVRQFSAQKAATKSRLGQLKKRIEQLHQEISGLKAQRVSTKKQFEIASQELLVSKDLLERGLTQRQNVLTVEREVAQLEGADGQLISQIARAEGRISETELQIIQISDDNRTRTLEELREAESKFRELSDRLGALKEKMARAIIVAPWSGFVHDLEVFNAGAVISPGQAIMAIVPDEDDLLIETEVRPQDIDQISIGQAADLVFENANNQITPRLQGKVKSVSAYLNTAQQQDTPPYYTIQIEADSEAIDQLEGLELKAGMPVSVFIQTAPRTPLSFLTKPASEMWDRVFREK